MLCLREAELRTPRLTLLSKRAPDGEGDDAAARAAAAGQARPGAPGKCRRAAIRRDPLVLRRQVRLRHGRLRLGAIPAPPFAERLRALQRDNVLLEHGAGLARSG